MIVGLYFIVVMTLLCGNNSDCGLITIFYKAGGLIIASKDKMVKVIKPGARRPAAPGFLKSLLCRSVCVCRP